MRVIDTTGREVQVNMSSSGFLDGGAPSPSGGVLDLIGSADGALRRQTYTQVYRGNPYLWACVQLYARSMSRFPLKVYRGGGETTVRVRPSDGGRAGSLAAVLRRPGYRRSRQALVHATTVDRMVHGGAVWFPDRDSEGNYQAIRRIPWKYVDHEVIAGVLRYWDTRTPTRKRLADDVVHFGVGLDCDDVISPSPIETLRATIALYDAVERHLVAYFRNSARPSGHIEVEKGTGKTARDMIRDELEKLYSGPENAGRVLVTSGKWSAITEAPGNSQVVELAKQSREEICAAFACPPPMIGILDRAIMSNVKELRSHLTRDVVGPFAGLNEGDIDAQMIVGDPLLERDEISVEFELNATLRPDLESRAATWKDQRYLLTLNEMRELENRPRIDHPDADVPWMPLNEAPLGADDSPTDPDRPGSTENDPPFRPAPEDDE